MGFQAEDSGVLTFVREALGFTSMKVQKFIRVAM